MQLYGRAKYIYLQEPLVQRYKDEVLLLHFLRCSFRFFLMFVCSVYICLRQAF